MLGARCSAVNPYFMPSTCNEWDKAINRNRAASRCNVLVKIEWFFENMSKYAYSTHQTSNQLMTVSCWILPRAIDRTRKRKFNSFTNHPFSREYNDICWFWIILLNDKKCKPSRLSVYAVMIITDWWWGDTKYFVHLKVDPIAFHPFYETRYEFRCSVIWFYGSWPISFSS